MAILTARLYSGAGAIGVLLTLLLCAAQRRPATRLAVAMTRVFALLVVLGCATPAIVAAQTATAPALKAAYLLKFIPFTEWPAVSLAPGGAIALCVVNDRAVADELTVLAKGRLVEGHTLVVSTPKADAAALASCHLLFASGLDAKGSAALIASVAGRPVLTVSDMENFAERGGVVRFFIERGTVQFAINREAAKRAGLGLRHQLLRLAKIVKDQRDGDR
jgi:hypothetical protein